MRQPHSWKRHNLFAYNRVLRGTKHTKDDVGKEDDKHILHLVQNDDTFTKKSLSNINSERFAILITIKIVFHVLSSNTPVLSTV